MDLVTLRTELKAFGLHDWGDDATGTARLTRLINEAEREICDLENWDFLYVETTGTMPKTFTDLKFVEDVIDTPRQTALEWADRKYLNSYDPGLQTTGSPSWWYFTGDQTINVYPANTSTTFSIRYFKRPAALSADADVPTIPEEYHTAIVLGAARKGFVYKEMAAAEQYSVIAAEWDRIVGGMRARCLVRQMDGGFILRHADDL